MSDPRLNDPRYETPPTDPAMRRSVGPGATSSVPWAWIGGIAAVILIAILVLGNWPTGTDTPMTANNPAATSPAGSPPVRNVTPPTTTGSGATSPTQNTPAPNRPAPQTNQ